MTAEEFREARRALGLSAARMARLLGLADGRLIRRYESGEVGVSGPVAALLDLLSRCPARLRAAWIELRVRDRH